MRAQAVIRVLYLLAEYIWKYPKLQILNHHGKSIDFEVKDGSYYRFQDCLSKKALDFIGFQVKGSINWCDSNVTDTGRKPVFSIPIIEI